MTEEESKKALFDLHFQYMMHPPKERLELYDEYQKQRAKIKNELAKLIFERKQQEMQTKVK